MEIGINIAQDSLSPYVLIFKGRVCTHVSKALTVRLGVKEEKILDFIKRNPAKISAVLDNGTDKISLPKKEKGTLAFQAVSVISDDSEAIFLSEPEEMKAFRLTPGIVSSLAENSTGICIIMRDGVIVYSSPHFAELLGYKAKEVLGKPFLSFVSKAHRAEFISAWMKNSKISEFEIRKLDVVLRTKTGALTYARMEGNWHNRQKKDLFLVRLIDLTEQERLKASLRNTEKRFLELFDTSPVGILYLTHKGHIKDCNRFVSELIGFPREEIIGSFFTKFIKSSEEKQLIKDFEKLYTSGAEIRGKQCKVISKDKKDIVIEHSTRLITRKGHKVGALMAFVDITEKKALEEALVSKNIELQKTLDKITRMKNDLEVRAVELHNATEKLKELNATLSLLSITDGLTGIYNHRYFQDRLSQEANRVKRYKEDHLSLLMLDIDDFKEVNDSFGHQNGDVVLKNLARLLAENVRNIDIVARYGGEEFAVILPKTDSQHAYLAGKRIKDAISAAPIPIEKKGIKVNITVSIGTATIEDGSGDAQDLIRMADHALYKAKAKGKNRIEIWKKG
jgi:diguanylate cyclase (GGDEF)-like protein/PAS domain S-box-containing protein